MDPLLNPYTPNAGARPPVIVGRNDELASFDLLLARLRRGRSEQSMLITGLRGVGKTVLLGQFRERALASNWSVLEMEVRKHDDRQFRRELATKLRAILFDISPRARWSDSMRRAAAALRSFTLTLDQDGTFGASMGLPDEPAEGTADTGDLTLDLTDLLVTLGEAAAAHETGVVLLFDEVQFLSRGQLESVITAIHKLVQRQLPVTLVGAGLPQIAELAGDAKSYAERLFKFPAIGNLTGDDARRALADPAAEEGAILTPAALDRAVDITGGYPYFIQELGHAVWGVAAGPTITEGDVMVAQEIYEAKLDSSFFRVRLDRASEREKDYLRAMAELGATPQRAADVAEVLGRTSSQVAPIRARLIAMGLLFTPSHGFAEFTVPHFDAFLRRAMPTWSAPQQP